MGHNEQIRVENLKLWFDLRSTFLESFSKDPRYVRAVDGVSFNIKHGETFGLVGESGCGKTTTGRVIMWSLVPTSGKVFFEDNEIFSKEKKDIFENRALKMQMIFQDPYEYLSPWYSVERTLSEPLQINNLVNNKEETLNKVIESMEMVGLTPIESLLSKRPYELSGGQRQRVIIARALILNPMFLVADEPVSMLDVSIRVNILNLLIDLKNKLSLTTLFITHDFAVARYITDRIGVMYLGKILEKGPTDNIIKEPLHPYTKALIAAVPVPDPLYESTPPKIKGGVPSPVNMPTGCRFHPRCPYAIELCSKEEPELMEVGKDHYAACHLVNEINP